MTKEYTTKDLFITRWEDLGPLIHAEVFALHQSAKALDPGSVQHGLHMIGVLRHLRKDRGLVSKINEAQAVDLYNDLVFLDEPWLYFPVRLLNTRAGLLYAPDEKMATHTFDHFIYADNEFTFYLATQDRKYLVRLAATLYRRRAETYFDKEQVDSRAQLIGKKIMPWQEDLIFWTYGHIRQFITKRCKMLLPATPTSPRPSSEGEGEVQEKTVPTGAMWLKLKHRLAETPAFQGYDNAGRANMYSALDYLEDLAQIKEKK